MLPDIPDISLKSMGKKLLPPDSTTICQRSSNLEDEIRHSEAMEDIHITIDSSRVSIHKGKVGIVNISIS